MPPSIFDFISLLTPIGSEPKTVFFRKKQIIFSHGDRSESIFYIEKGTVKLTITSANGKEALIRVLDEGEFFGESCLMPEKPLVYTPQLPSPTCSYEKWIVQR